MQEREGYARKLAHLASTDGLTGLHDAPLFWNGWEPRFMVTNRGTATLRCSSLTFDKRSGDIVDIGRWVQREACLQAATWPDSKVIAAPWGRRWGDLSLAATSADHLAPAVSVNVSPAQILLGSLVADVLDALSVSCIPARRLHLEITEGPFAGGRPLTCQVLTDLRERGHTNFA